MREIEFRGLSLLDENWEYGFYTIEGVCGVIRRYDSKPNQEGTPIIVRRETVGQYTGLTDKDMNRIYEGDILFDNHNEEFGKVVFEEGKFLYENTTWVTDLFEISDTIERKGNIHQNKELLK